MDRQAIPSVKLLAIIRSVYRIYIRIFIPQSFVVNSFIKRHAPTQDIDLYVELGCGARHYQNAIEKAWKPRRCIGTDVTENIGVQVVADALSMPLRSASADLVSGFQMIQHVPDYRTMLAEAKRILAPGGYLILSYPFLYPECDVRDMHRWTMEGMDAEVRRSGFEVLAHQTIGGPLFMGFAVLEGILASLVPGRRTAWRAAGSPFGLFRVLVLTIIGIPIHLFGWLALALDRFWRKPSAYMGALILAKATK